MNCTLSYLNLFFNLWNHEYPFPKSWARHCLQPSHGSQAGPLICPDPGNAPMAPPLSPRKN
jgi:hypothetical protein